MGKFVDYIKGSYNEFMNRVTWPNWDELQSATLVVAVFALLVAGVTAFADWIINTGVLNLFKL
ncbi:MAG: preprotein translocase subunit SecE [Flavobacteriales bacterium]